MNTNWLYFSLIIAGVLIILAVITPSILHVIFSHRQNNTSVQVKRNDKQRNISNSAVWAPIVFLSVLFLVVGICMFSFAYSGCSRLLEFMSLSSAIVSIILAVLTIVYSYYTTNSNMKNLGKVEEGVDTIIETSEQISKISEQADRLEEMLDELKPYIGSEVQKLSEALNGSGYANSPLNGTDNSGGESLSRPFDYDRFLQTFSPNGILFLYMCVKCSNEKPVVNFLSISKIFEQTAVQYFMGILVTLNSLFGMPCIVFDYDSSLLKINYIDEDFKKAIEKSVGLLYIANKPLVDFVVNRIEQELGVDAKLK